MKKLFTLIGTVLLSMSVNAQSETTLGMEAFSIKPGETKTVTLNLHNPDFVVSGFSCGLLLPEGLDVAKKKNGKYNIVFNEDAERYDDHSISTSLHPDGTVTMVVMSNSAANFYETEGAILDIPIVAAADASGVMEIKITKQDIVDSKGTQVKAPDVVVPVNVTAIKEVNATETVNGDGKYLKNGQIIIKKGNKEYNAIGGIMK